MSRLMHRARKTKKNLRRSKLFTLSIYFFIFFPLIFSPNTNEGRAMYTRIPKLTAGKKKKKNSNQFAYSSNEIMKLQIVIYVWGCFKMTYSTKIYILSCSIHRHKLTTMLFRHKFHILLDIITLCYSSTVAVRRRGEEWNRSTFFFFFFNFIFWMRTSCSVERVIADNSECHRKGTLFLRYYNIIYVYTWMRKWFYLLYLYVVCAHLKKKKKSHWNAY